jgi:hypothetical protein
MTFMAPGLTFNRNDIPQFLIKDFAKDDTTEQAASDSRGLFLSLQAVYPALLVTAGIFITPVMQPPWKYLTCSGMVRD